jgi:hypothetical protein
VGYDTFRRGRAVCLKAAILWPISIDIRAQLAHTFVFQEYVHLKPEEAPMDFKKIVDKVKGAAEDLKEKAEVKIREARDSLDKNHDNIPDALEGLTEKAQTLAGQVQEKAKVLAEQAEEKAKAVAGMAKEKFEQATSKGAADEGAKKS